MTQKTRQDSFTRQIQIVMPQDSNPSGRLFGGVLMQWVDIVASVVARRHSCAEVVTVCIDSVDFCVGASVGSTVVIEGLLTYVGNSSMEIAVHSYVETYENGSAEKAKISSAHLVMVAVDKNQKSVRVPRLKINTELEKKDWELAKKRADERYSRRKTQEE